MSRHVVAIALAVLSLCACTTLAGRDPLQVAVAGIEPLQGEGLELRFLVKLRVQNPNSTPVDLRRRIREARRAGQDIREPASATPAAP